METERELLEIMKDSHCGAFAVICLLLYFLLFFGAACQIESIAFTGCFVVSRILAGIGVTYLPNARGRGLLLNFSSEMDKVKIQKILWGTLAIWLAVWIYFFPMESLCMSVVCLMISAYFYRMCRQKFGGITGDLAGWYISVLELSTVLALAFQDVIF